MLAWAGARITGVDDRCFSSSGESFSTVLLPKSESTTIKELQSDDVSLAYEFSKKECNTAQPTRLCAC